MKKYSLIVAIVIVLIGGFLWWQKSASDESKQSISGQFDTAEYTIRLPDENLVFTYKRDLGGYQLEDRVSTTTDHPTLIRRITLTPIRDYIDQSTREGGEGSPAWTLAVYSNDLNQSPSTWADINAQESNIALAISPQEEIIVAGASGISYTIDGLYRNKVIIFASGSSMYVIHGAYLDETSPTYTDFPAWIDSFRFTPPQAVGSPQGKIDPRVACESALVYMTFPGGKEADIFVAECMEGKHPEVIERYIKDMGLDGAVI